MTNELLPCPFCGGELKIDWSMGSQYWAYCPNDKCCFYETLIYDSVSELVEACNTRAERTCKLIGRGSFMPKHDFYRSECSACGAMFWQTNGHLPRANYCPHCGAKVVE